MNAITGEYTCKMDAKGRLVLPAKIKAVLPADSEQTVVLSRGFEPCIVIYPLSEWEKIRNRVSELNEFNEGYRNFRRNFFRGSTEAETDKLGRFLIPKSMIAYAGLEKETIVVGAGNCAEIWNPDRYNEYLINDRAEYSRLAEEYLGSEDKSKNTEA